MDFRRGIYFSAAWSSCSSGMGGLWYTLHSRSDSDRGAWLGLRVFCASYVIVDQLVGWALLSGLVLDAGVLRASSVLVCLTLGLWGVCAVSLSWAMSVRGGIGLVVGCRSIVVGVRSLPPWFWSSWLDAFFYKFYTEFFVLFCHDAVLLGAWARVGFYFSMACITRSRLSRAIFVILTVICNFFSCGFIGMIRNFSR